MKITKKAEGWWWIIAGIWLMVMSISGYYYIELDAWAVLAMGAFILARVSRW